MYLIKTRNYSANKTAYQVFSFLVKYFGVSSDEIIEENDIPSIDLDIKYWCYTKNHFEAWFLWVIFMVLRKWSGGWTYIVLPGHELYGGDYKSIF
jgi:hypothetical protein